MGFRMIDPRRIKKVKTPGGQEVLRKLQEFLDESCGETAEFLCRFWKDQQNAITYKELRQAVMDGDISRETLRLWQQDYSVLVANRFRNVWEDAMKAGAVSQPVMNGKVFEFYTQTPGIMSWIQNRGAAFVTSCTQEQKAAISALLSKKMVEGHTVDELARMIRPCIGLTENQAKANARYYDSIVSNLKKEHPRMSPESIQKKAQDAAAKYAERQHRQRAMTIAQTESAFAYNRGADEGIRQAQAQGLLGQMMKRWSTSGDDAVCSICQGLEGVELGMDEGFDFKGRLLFAEQNLMPPAHPRCACAVEYIEVENQKFENYLQDAETGYRICDSQLIDLDLAGANMEAESEAIIWPEQGEKISKDEYRQVMAYAREKGIEMTGFKHFDGNLQTLIDLINDADSVVKHYPAIKEGRKRFTIALDYTMNDADFAITRGHIVSINGNAYRDIQRLEKEYQSLEEAGWFVKGTDYHSMIKHEIGHVVANMYGIDSLEIATNITGLDAKNIWEYINKELSQYASVHKDGSEIVSEVFAKVYSLDSPGDFSLQFIQACANIIKRM